MDVPRDQISSFLDHGLFSSAHMVGCFLMSSAGSNAEAENLVLTGDALFGGKEFRRAVFMYKQALLHAKMMPKQTAISSRSSFHTSSRSSSPNSSNVSAIDENEVKFKVALCLTSLEDNRAALSEIESVPNKARTLKMNLTMGKLYRICKHNRAAISCYKDCLRHCPYVLEAIVALSELGVSSRDIISLFPQTPTRGGRLPFDHFDTSRWLQRYAEAHCLVASNDFKGGLDLFCELLQRFPCNVHLLLEIAKVEAIMGKNKDAILRFEKIRTIDPYVIAYMDEYAILLKEESEDAKLNRLVHDLVNIDPMKAEVLVALSALWERKDERRAFAYAEKSVRVDDRNIPGFIMKGNLCLSLNRPDAAAIAFRNAQEIRPDLRSFQGLVRSYLALSKPKEALFAAREALKTMPQSAKALKLVGDVHASNPGHRDKARKFYESALRLEPSYLCAVLSLAELLVVEGRLVDAMSLLQRYLEDWPDDSLHVKLAQIYSMTDKLSDSLWHYQSALRINPHNKAAKKGLGRLERQMKGMEPDAPEDDEDGGEEVEDLEESDMY